MIESDIIPEFTAHLSTYSNVEEALQPAVDMRGRVRQAVREAQNVLGSTRDAHRQQTALLNMAALLPDAAPSSAASSLFGEEDRAEAGAVFMREHYSRFIDFLLGVLSVDWVGRLPRGQMSTLYDVFFLRGDAADALTALCRKIDGGGGLQRNKSCSLLEVFLRQHCLDDILWRQSVPSALRGATEGAFHTQQRDDLVCLIATLPERVSNQFEQQTSNIFYPAVYIPLVCKSVLTVLRRIHGRIVASEACSITFLASLLGKLCISGYGDAAWSSLLAVFTSLMYEDHIWCHLLSSLIAAVPPRCLESVIVPLVKQASGYNTLTKMLGLTVLTNQKLEFILTTKLLLMRYFSQDIVLQNIIGYLASTRSTVPLYVKTFLKLFEVWSDAGALRHTSYEQHLYITKALLICVAFLEPQEREQLKDSLLQTLMQGIQCHLDSSLLRVRRLGMIVGEAVTRAANTEGEPLTFEYEKDDETSNLMRLLVKPVKIQPDPVVSAVEVLSLEDEDKKTSVTLEQTTTVKPADGVKVEPASDVTAGLDLDSDDDFEPFDMSKDVKVNKTKSPMYIRDCMEGLLNSDDPDRVEVCLLVADKLIRLHPRATAEVATEFTKILLHLQDSAAIDSFLGLRHQAMVAITVNSPTEIATYLTGEFYERNYNLRQRIDILEVLGSAARELSHRTPPSERDPLAAACPADRSTGAPEGWREVVQRRIESHTRRFAADGGARRPARAAVENRFAPVAGHFFFPLLRNFDRKENCLDMMAADHMMLRRLICTLGILMHEALNAPIVRQMATALLQFIWVLRYHPESSIRQALLFALSMTVLSLPAHTLITDLHDEMSETRDWLQDVTEKDVDHECQKMAVQTLALIEHIVRKEFGSKDAGR